MEKLKHNHKLTDILKVLVFALIILFPFIVLTPTLCYYGNNKYATNENYIATPKYQTNEVNSTDDLILGNVYHMDILNIKVANASDTDLNIEILKVNSCTFNVNDAYSDELYINNYDAKNNNNINLMYYEGGTISLSMSNDKGYATFVLEDSDNYLQFNDVDFIILEYLNNFIDWYDGENWDNLTASTYQDYEYTKINNITDNVSYAWEEMWNTNLFSWTKNSPFKTSINGFLAVFQIDQQSGLGLYLNYLITMIGIYVVIDIVIELFKWLTHLIGQK